MQILFVLHRSPEGVPAGTELHTLDLAAHLSPQVRPFLFYPEDGRVWLRALDGTVRESAVYSQPASRFIEGHPDVEQFFAQVLGTQRIDLIHFQHLLNLPVSLGQVAVAHRVPYVVTVHDYFFWCVNYNLLRDLKFCWFETNLEVCRRCLAGLGMHADLATIAGHRQRMRAFLQSADAVVCASRFVRESLTVLHPQLSPSRMHVIEMASSVAPVRPLAPRFPGPLRVAFLGAFVPPKGSHYFIRLVERFASRTDIIFFVVGVDPSNAAKQFSARANVHWLGQYTRHRLAGLLRDYSIDLILILSPWAETFSYTLSEAIQASIPVIATDLGALRERVSRDGVGFLVEADDPVPRVAVLLEDIAAHPEILEPFRTRCLEAARRLPDVATSAGRYLEIYHEVALRTGQ